MPDIMLIQLMRHCHSTPCNLQWMSEPYGIIAVDAHASTATFDAFPTDGDK